ncbi:uncharacterized protein [Nicotiana tomentosiformis]|uniref:uncharacterized protein n=1 Tax=Nicotiana tomentosiformis TaxID=4098 RepID=UPI00388CC193
MREKGSNKGKILGKEFTEAMKQAFLAAYEDNGSDKEEEKEDEAISLYAVNDEHQAVETEPPVQLGMHIGRPPLFDGHHYDKWKLHMETFLQATDFDLWVIFSHGPTFPTKMDGEGNKYNQREEEYGDEDFDVGDENIEVALMAIEKVKKKEELIGMMAMSDSETEDETKQVKDLKNQVLELTSKNEKFTDIHGKKKMSDLQDKLEKELKRAKDNICDVECRNKVLHENLAKVNYELSRQSKWHRSSDALVWQNENCSSNKLGIGYGKPVPKYDPKYVGIFDNKMCTHCGKAKVRGKDQDRYLDIGCSRHMTGEKKNFLSLIAFQGGSVSFGNGKKGQITGIGKVGLKHNLLSISQMCDKGNEVKFNSKIYIVTKLATDEIVLKGKRHNNVYKISIISLPEREHTCLSVVEDDPLLWHKRLGHASLSQLNKLAAKDLHLQTSRTPSHGPMWTNESEEQRRMIQQKLGCNVISIRTDHGLKNEDYDIGLTGDGDHKESEPQSEDGSGDHKEIDNNHEEQEEERTTMTTNQTDEAIPTEHMRPWKHQSSHPLENTIYVPNVKVQTRSSLRNLCALTTFLSQVKPKNIKEALKDLDWIIAMQDELNQFERSKVLHLLQRPKNRTVICTRWVFRNKLDEQENITRNKARLVV